jgi:hypothetical protein
MKKMIELTPKQASEKIQQNNQVLFLIFKTFFK